ncbi:endoglucanase [Stigmatella sp. ncwal1]|uniref:Endoglucanase n=1 Tax=Stigmatella ashevillensis TaxID=2995309 RepID=A0ABT5DK09_9BACT|nr:endoglucanase [Stigmatella ashevillena]MDC0713480.1 endoglucanase [Stigmatella ashevillena]
MNRPPVFTSVPTASSTDLDEQTSILLSVSASDPDGDPLTYSWGGTDLTGMGPPVPGTFSDPTLPTPTWTAPNIHFRDREYMLSVTVSDGRGGTVKRAVYVIVFWIDEPPTVEQLTGPTTLVSGQQGLFTVAAADPELDMLWFSWGQRLPAAPLGSFSPIMGPEEEEHASMYWTAPTVSEETLFILNVWVTDDSSPSEERTLTVHVTPAELP